MPRESHGSVRACSLDAVSSLNNLNSSRDSEIITRDKVHILQDNKDDEVIRTRDMMNTVTSVNFTSLEINDPRNRKLSNLENKNHQQYTSREKMQQSPSSTKVNKYTFPISNQIYKEKVKLKETQASSEPNSSTENHKPASRSKSHGSITEEKTVFGFKIMKNLPSSSDQQNGKMSRSSSNLGLRDTTSRKPATSRHFEKDDVDDLKKDYGGDVDVFHDEKEESLHKDKTRLEKKGGSKKTQSHTNPVIHTTDKEKKVSESVNSIRERVRDRKLRKEQSHQPTKSESQSSPLTENVKSTVNEENISLENNFSKRDKRTSRNFIDVTSSEANSLDQNSNVKISQYGEFVKKDHEKCSLIDDQMIGKDSMNLSYKIGKTLEKDGDCEQKTFDKNLNVASLEKTSHGTTHMKLEIDETSSEINGKTKTENDSSVNKKTNATQDLHEGKQGNSEVKKSCKRETRKKQRYQRSKTINSLMFDEISLDARREMQHKGMNVESNESLALPSVSEIRKRFIETENSSAKLSELGLFFSSKANESTSSKKKTRSNTKAYTSRRHTLATTFATQDPNDDFIVGFDLKTNEDKRQDNVLKNEETKNSNTLLTRQNALSHNLPLKSDEENSSTLDSVTHNTNSKGSFDKNGKSSYRQRISSDEITSSSIHAVKKSESVVNLRERFSKGGAPEFKLATSKSMSHLDSETNSYGRDNNVRKIIEEAKNLKKSSSTGGDDWKNSNEVFEDRQTYLNRYLSQEDHPVSRRGSSPEEEGESGEKSTKKVDKKKTKSQNKRKAKVRDRRAQTVAGSSSKDIIKEIADVNIDSDEGNSIVSSNFYVAPSTYEDKEKEKPQLARQTSDLIPDNYLSPFEEKKSELQGDKVLQENAKTLVKSHIVNEVDEHDVELPNFKEASKDINGLKRTSNGDDVEVSVSRPVFSSRTRRRSKSESGIDTLADQETEELEIIDAMELKTSSTSTILQTRNEKEPLKNGYTSKSSQHLDDYLSTAIETLTKQPKGQQRSSPRTFSQQEKFTFSENFGNGANVNGESHMVVKSPLISHSWSTSDLSKFFYRDGNESSSKTRQVDLSAMDFDEISSSTTR